MKRIAKLIEFRVLLGLHIAVGLFLSSAHAVEISFIEQQELQILTNSFESAKTLKSDNLKDILGPIWTCNLFGTRTRMQIERNLHLYDLSQSGSKTEFANKGAQVIRNYSFSKGSLIGKKENLKETLRLSSEGNLIGRIEHLDPESKKPIILAYSSCTLKSVSQATLNK